MTHAGIKLSCVLALCAGIGVSGCVSERLGRQQRRLHQELLMSYDVQLIRNLGRASVGLPVLQIRYGAVGTEVSAEVGFKLSGSTKDNDSETTVVKSGSNDTTIVDGDDAGVSGELTLGGKDMLKLIATPVMDAAVAGAYDKAVRELGGMLGVSADPDQQLAGSVWYSASFEQLLEDDDRKTWYVWIQDPGDDADKKQKLVKALGTLRDVAIYGKAEKKPDEPSYPESARIAFQTLKVKKAGELWTLTGKVGHWPSDRIVAGEFKIEFVSSSDSQKKASATAIYLGEGDATGEHCFAVSKLEVNTAAAKAGATVDVKTEAGMTAYVQARLHTLKYRVKQEETRPNVNELLRRWTSSLPAG